MSVPSSHINNALSVSQLGQYLNGSQQTPGVSMTAGGANQGLQNFLNTPAATLAYGTGPAQQLAQTGQYNPSQTFLNDPGTQMAIQAGMPALTNAYAAKGLGNSGALSQALSQYMYNNYGNYIGGQESMLGNYQSQLANLAQFGSTQTGGAQALQNGQTAAGLLGPANLGTAQNLSEANLSASQNNAQLLANQGVFGGNAYLGTAAAQSNNIMQGMSLAQQQYSNQQASNASAAGGQGALGGYGGGAF